MATENRRPIGIELVRKGLITESDIEKALVYQKNNPDKKLGDIFQILGLCNESELIQAISEIVGVKPILLNVGKVKVNPTSYMSIDIIKQNKVMPFEINGNKIKVAFADVYDTKMVEMIRMLLLNRGLILEKYITFLTYMENTIKAIEGTITGTIDSSKDITGLVDSIIRNAMEKRTSDIHIEPLEDKVRVRYRIDGELLTVAEIQKNKQTQIIGRLKAISNMHQEKQDSQDGRITMYDDYNIRVSSQKNIYGEKFVLRLLKKNEDIKTIKDLGFQATNEYIDKHFNKRNSIVVVAAPTGEGKTTTLYSIVDFLNRPEINITTIENPVEIRIPGLNQIEIDNNITFSNSLRTVLRQDPDVILVGEVRDVETAEILIEAGHTGHSVLTTIHTIDAIEVITRLRKLGVSNYDIASAVATSISQRLIRKRCDCAKPREFTEEEKQLIYNIGQKYHVNFDLEGKITYEKVGCDKCNHTGYYGRIGIFELLSFTDDIKELLVQNASIIQIRNKAIENGYLPLVVDGINKVLKGVTTLEELNRKVSIF